MVQFRGGFVVVVVGVAALNLKAQVLWLDLGISDLSLGSKFKLFVCISPILAMSRRKQNRNLKAKIGGRGFL